MLNLFHPDRLRVEYEAYTSNDEQVVARIVEPERPPQGPPAAEWPD